MGTWEGNEKEWKGNVKVQEGIVMAWMELTAYTAGHFNASC